MSVSVFLSVGGAFERQLSGRLNRFVQLFDLLFSSSGWLFAAASFTWFTMSSTQGKTAFDWDLYQNRTNVLITYRDSRQYMDGLLVSADGTSIPVHLVVVSGLGDFFTRFMFRQVNDPENGRVELEAASGPKNLVKKVVFPDISTAVLKTLVDVAYTGVLTTDASSVWQVLEVAERYRLKDVESGCCTFVSSLVSATNCLEMYRLGKQKFHHKLLQASLTAMRHHFRDVVEKSIFFSLIEAKDLNSMLAADDLNAETEEYVWNVIQHWVTMDLPHRFPHLYKLISNLRFERVSVQFLTDLSCNPLITDPKQHGKLIATVRRMINTRKRAGYEARRLVI